MNRRLINGSAASGFTLLELLIVIAIIAVLAVILIIVINPAETLRKTRDAQRISDTSTLKTSVGIFTTSTTTVYLAGASSNAGCKTGAGGGTYGAGSKVYYSLPSDGVGGAITDTTLDGGVNPPLSAQVATASLNLTDSTGWLPIAFNSLTSGSPISNLPVDPVNQVNAIAGGSDTLGSISNKSLMYRYACNSTSLTYEIDAVLESTEYTSGTNNKLVADGGNNSNYYEAGTNLLVLGAGTDI